MIDVLVGLEALVLGHPNGAGLADLAQVVAQQVDNHGELGVVLGAVLQFPAQGCVFPGGSAPGTGPLDGPGLQVIPPAAEEALMEAESTRKSPQLRKA